MDLRSIDLKTPHNQLSVEDERLHLNANAQSFRSEEWSLAELRVFGYREIVRHQASCHYGEAQSAERDLAGKGCGQPALDHRTKSIGVHEEGNGCCCENWHCDGCSQANLDRLLHESSDCKKRATLSSMRDFVPAVVAIRPRALLYDDQTVIHAAVRRSNLQIRSSRQATDLRP